MTGRWRVRSLEIRRRRSVPAAAVAIASTLAGLPDLAAAQPATRDLAIRAAVPKYCTTGGRVGPVDVELVIEVGEDGRAKVTAASVTRPTVVCNAPAELRVASLRAGARQTGAAAVLHWRAAVSFGTARSTLDTTSPAPVAAVTTGPVIGTLEVSFEAAPAAIAPGIYRDVLRIVLVPR